MYMKVTKIKIDFYIKFGMILQQKILNFRNKAIRDGDKSSRNW